MSNGPGKYNVEASAVLRTTKAEGVVLIILAGSEGDGFECIAPPWYQAILPEVLRGMADEIEGQAAAGPPPGRRLPRPRR